MVNIPYDTLYYAILVVSLISMSAIVFILVLFFKHRQDTSNRGELIIYLCIATFLSSLSYTIPWRLSKESAACKIQGNLMLIAETAQYICAALVGYDSYHSIVKLKGENIRFTWKRRFVYIMIGFGFPSVLAVITNIVDRIGPAKPWCWIQAYEDEISCVYQIFLYCIFFGSGVLNIIFALIVIKNLSNETASDPVQSKQHRDVICKMFRYPIVLVITIFPSVLIRAIKRETIDTSTQKGTDILNSIGMIGISSFGAFAVFSYVFSCDIIRMLRNYMKADKKGEEEESEINMSSFVSM